MKKTKVQRMRASVALLTDAQLTDALLKLHKMKVAPFADLIGAPRQSVYRWLLGKEMSPGYRKLLESMFVEAKVASR